MGRARRTARLIGKPLGLSATPIESLRERAYGERGLTAEIDARFREAFSREHAVDEHYAIPGANQTYVP